MPAGLRRTTAKTMIALIGEAERSLCFAAPYVDRPGMWGPRGGPRCGDLTGGEVEVFELRQWAQGAGATEGLRRGIERMGDPTRLSLVRLATDGPWPYLKVLVADDQVA